MRLQVRHELVQNFDFPVRAMVGQLRVTPRSHEAHHVVNWRVDVEADCQVRQTEDAFGNIVHSFSMDAASAPLVVRIDGEVETLDSAGVVRGAAERFPPGLYLRETASSAADAPLRAMAQQFAAGATGPLAKAHALMDNLHERGDAAKDRALQFIGCARLLGIPARHASGYLAGGAAAACHGWAEAYVEGIGWIGFDPAAGICPKDGHVRLACGLDALGTALWRCGTTPGGTAAAEMKVFIRQAGVQSQS